MESQSVTFTQNEIILLVNGLSLLIGHEQGNLENFKDIMALMEKINALEDSFEN